MSTEDREGLRRALDTAERYGRETVTLEVARVRELLAQVEATVASAEQVTRETLDRVIAAVEDTYPPYNYELRGDGTEDPASAAYVEAFREVDAALAPFRGAPGQTSPQGASTSM